jgi:hypothetical protein
MTSKKDIHYQICYQTIQTLLKVINFEDANGYIMVNGEESDAILGYEDTIPDDKTIQHSTEYQTIQSIKRTEPRIELIARLIKSLNIFTLDQANSKNTISSFRLKNLNDWLTPIYGDQTDAIINYLSWSCKISCEFCYQKGHPPNFKLQKPNTSREELSTRLKYYSPQNGTALFEQTLHNIDEILNNPIIYDILPQLREKSEEPLILLTNGVSLTEENIKRLQKFKPLLLPVSIHSFNQDLRKRLVHDRNPGVALNSPQLLEKYSIPYEVVIVRWPSIPFEDLRATIHKADKHNASTVRVLLPGYSKYFPLQNVFDLDEWWTETIRQIRTIREEVSLPVIIEPNHYEENVFEPEGLLDVKIYGVIKNSPAWKAGLRRGDIIKSFNNIDILTRKQLIDLLFEIGESKSSTKVNVKVLRKEETIELTLVEENNSNNYPYFNFLYSFGLLVNNNFDENEVVNVYRIIEERKAKSVLLLTSKLVEPTLKRLLDKYPSSNLPCELFIEIPPNKYLGGNICMGDLLVVEDFIDFINNWIIKTNHQPDLILIPASPFYYYVGSSWNRDITGKVFSEIERRIGIPVELMKCERLEGV